MLTVTVIFNYLRFTIPPTILFGTAPSYFLVWFSWRTVTALLPHRVFKIGDEFLYSTYQRMVLFFFETVTGVKICLAGDLDALFGNVENVLYLSNHQSDLDWIIVNMLAVRQGCIGKIRYVLKNELKAIPLYGFYFNEHGCIYVKRSKGQFNKERMLQNLEQMRRKGDPGWVVIFPEGTRYLSSRPSLTSKSRDFAQEQGLPCLEYHLTPRARATQLCLLKLRQNLDAVYDITVFYDKTYDTETGKRVEAIGMFEYCVKPVTTYIHIKRIDIDDVPQDEEKIRHWLHRLFVEKDKMAAQFYSSDSTVQQHFLEQFHHNQLSWESTIPSFALWFGITLISLCTPLGRNLYWWSALYGSLVGYTILGVKKVS